MAKMAPRNPKRTGEPLPRNPTKLPPLLRHRRQIHPHPEPASEATHPPQVDAASPIVSSDAAEERLHPATQRVSVTPSMSDAPIASRNQEDSHASKALAIGWPPKTLDERYARQEYASRLDPAPAIYNMIVFGEAPLPGM